MKRVIGVAAGVAVLVTALGGVSGANGAASAAPDRRAIEWRACGKAEATETKPDIKPDGKSDTKSESKAEIKEQPPGKLECATLNVPLDYAEPSGRQITLALNRIKGTPAREGDRLGVLLINPGGPGASGRDLTQYVATSLPKDVARRFDIVGFDPRGVGASRPALTCVDAKRFFKAPRPDNVPRTQAEETVLRKRAKEYADACGSRWSWLLSQMTTANSARDMDAIRRALGQSKISYLGYSYGTYLGAVYATMFPSRVKRMVLDSVVDPNGVWYADNLGQDIAFDRRHQDFLRWVARHNATYKLGDTLSETTSAWYAMRDRLRNHPARGVVGPSEFDDIFTTAGYSDLIWPELAGVFSDYVRKGSAGKLLKAYKSYGTTNTAQSENGYAVYLAVECRDAMWPRDWATWHNDSTEVNSQARFMTWPNAWYNAPCAFWPVRGSTPVHLGARGLPPALLIQAQRDAATPSAGAVRMLHLFPGARLVTVPGGNHGVSLNGNTCVDAHLAAYLRDGALPGRADSTTACGRGSVPVPAARAEPSGTGAQHGADRTLFGM